MSKELIERIKAFKFRQYEIAGWCHDDAVGLLTDCQYRIEVDAAAIAAHEARIEELEERNATMQSDINGWLVIKGNMTNLLNAHGTKQEALEQENSRLQGRVEAEAQSGMQSLRTQENLFGAKLDALQAQLEAASGYLGRLLTTVWPQIELCPDLMGICTQIDHLLASLRDNRVKEDKEKV